ncbi:unnamed protein product [Lupinus luteus]|uniref:Uncharacterized protein n=1 Tax=Lupinus luteus TaxID=3873 RepID=A0AAV1WFD7_LUPLU
MQLSHPISPHHREIQRFRAKTFDPQGATKQTCNLLAVTCGSSFEQQKPSQNQYNYPFPELVSSGRLEGVELSTFEAITELFGPTLPTTVCILDFHYSMFLVVSGSCQ